VIATLVSHRVLRPMCVGVCGGVHVSQYGVFRDYSSSLVCVEFGERGRPKSYMTPQCSWVLSKKNCLLVSLQLVYIDHAHDLSPNLWSLR